MSEDRQVKRRGRPPKAEADRKDGNLTFRTRAGLREQLALASKASSRSISEEVERRVEGSFEVARHEAVMAAMLGGGRMAALLKDVIAGSNLIRPPEVSNTYELYRRAFIRAVSRIAAHHLPDNAPLMPPEPRTAEWEQACADADKLGDEIADLVLRHSLEALMDRLHVARLQEPGATQGREEEDDPAAFAGSAGLMRRWATEEGAAEKGDAVAKPSLPVKTARSNS